MECGREYRRRCGEDELLHVLVPTPLPPTRTVDTYREYGNVGPVLMPANLHRAAVGNEEGEVDTPGAPRSWGRVPWR